MSACLQDVHKLQKKLFDEYHSFFPQKPYQYKLSTGLNIFWRIFSYYLKNFHVFFIVNFKPGKMEAGMTFTCTIGKYFADY